MGLTTDPTDPRLKYGIDEAPVDQAEVYLVLSKDERAKGFVRPLRDTYLHKICNNKTKIGLALAETYARNPSFYGGTYCCYCQKHRPLSEFVWPDGSGVGT